ncbi:hypothetical protein N9D69_00155 [Flavobacteriales bacterium]|nr:hypothetical protein [Flavobacteriales bacterium]
MKQIILTLIVFFSLTSCTRILVKFYGLKNPEIEKYTSLSKYALKKNMNMEGNIYAPKDSINFYHFKNFFFVPDAIIFNANGHFVDYRETPESCNAGIDAFIKGLATNDTLNIDDTTLASDLLKRLIMLPNKQAVTFDGSYDYTIVMTWAKWSGRVVPNHIIPW